MGRRTVVIYGDGQMFLIAENSGEKGMKEMVKEGAKVALMVWKMAV